MNQDPSRTPARILLIDDHQIIRDGLRLLLDGQADLELVGNAYNSETGWQAIQELKPDLVVMDLNVPGEGGIALTKRVHDACPHVRVVVLTGHAESQHVQAALGAGAMGYVLKSNGFGELLQAIRTVLSGNTFLCPEVASIVVRHIQRSAKGAQSNGVVLSARESEVLRQLADGCSTKEIAFNLGVSAKTIETHRMHLMSKLGMHSVAELTKYAIREGLSQL